jgi:glycosyltransferase involved in cell wall biosynthesis
MMPDADVHPDASTMPSRDQALIATERQLSVAVIPALDEEDSIRDVVTGILAYVDVAVVVDNGSRDRTVEAACAAGADIVHEPRRGYGAACLAGVARARARGATIIVFLDADGSDDPRDAPRLLAPILSGEADLVLGVRTSASTEPSAMRPVQRFGNWLAPRLMRLAVGAPYHDMPPFRAVERSALDALALSDTGMGFIIETLLKAHTQGLRVTEVEVRCRARRSGKSKISGTVAGTVRASVKIVTAILRHAVVERFVRRRGHDARTAWR